MPLGATALAEGENQKHASCTLFFEKIDFAEWTVNLSAPIVCRRSLPPVGLVIGPFISFVVYRRRRKVH